MFGKESVERRIVREPPVSSEAFPIRIKRCRGEVHPADRKFRARDFPAGGA